MPEGPECRLTVDYLTKTLESKWIKDWVFCGGGYTDEPPEGFEVFDNALPLKVENVHCKGKFIYFILSEENGTNHYIMHSLMMTGRWQKDYDDYCKWFVELDDGSTVWFRSPRSLSTVSFTTDRSVLQDKLDKLGPDIMTRDFTLPNFKQLALKYSKRNITSFLMDQQVISGCGNYIKAEVLWYAQISPLRKVGELSERELELVFEGLRVIPRVSYNKKGVSLKDYANENGTKGYYAGDLKIYGKKYAKRTKTADGRTTYWENSLQENSLRENSL